jgi:hypothetical protein
MGPGWSEISGQALLGESRAEAQRMISSKAVSEVFAGNRALPRGPAATRPTGLLSERGTIRRLFMNLNTAALLGRHRVKRRVAMERNHHPASTFCLDPMTALEPQPNEAGFQQHRFGIRRS